MGRHIRWVAGVALGMCGVAALVSAAPTESPAPEAGTVTVQGEIVDPSLYLREGRRGSAATDLTYEAVDGGQTLALLDDAGALYLLLAEVPGEDPNELVYEHVNRKVKVTGRVFERGGLRGLVVSSVESLEPGGAAAPTISEDLGE